MFKTFLGIAAVLLACLCWGLIFVVPLFVQQFGSIEIALGRYLCYGLFSLLFLLLTRPKMLRNTSREIWIQAGSFALIMNFGYYISLILGLRYASPAIIALIIGVSPITIAIYGGYKEGEIKFKKLVKPSLLIFSGLICVNLYPLMFETSSFVLSEYLFGLFCGFFSLAVWTWYAVANVQFLQKYPQLDASNWTTILGVSTFFWALAGLFIRFWLAEPEERMRFATMDDELQTYLICCLVLGVMCSWVGFYLWNVASAALPVSLAGQLTIFETIFGLVYVYLFEARWPTVLELAGIFLMLGGIVIGVYTFMRAPQEAESAEELVHSP